MSSNNHTATSRQPSARPNALVQASKPADVELTETELGRATGGRKDPYKN
jgi:hypothetical protein